MVNRKRYLRIVLTPTYTGGTSPAVNPQIVDAGADGAINLPPSFVTLSGPVREARFIFFTDSAGNPTTVTKSVDLDGNAPTAILAPAPSCQP